jgi:hypothetical protein
LTNEPAIILKEPRALMTRSKTMLLDKESLKEFNIDMNLHVLIEKEMLKMKRNGKMSRRLIFKKQLTTRYLESLVRKERRVLSQLI